MVGTRDTTRDLQDAPDYTRLKNNAYKKAKEQTSNKLGKDATYFKTLARECYDSSTNWLNAGIRIAWNESLRAFQGLH